jgi:hypothetical protein
VKPFASIGVRPGKDVTIQSSFRFLIEPITPRDVVGTERDARNNLRALPELHLTPKDQLPGRGVG